MVTVPTRADLLRCITQHGCIAELGVFQGDFSAQILEQCDPCELHLIDRWNGQVACGDKDGKNGILLRNAVSAYIELHERYAHDPRVRIYRDETWRIRNFRNGSLDFVYVDADHSFEGCLSDLVDAAPKVKPNGFLGGHDYDSPYLDLIGVTVAVETFMRRHGWVMAARTTRDLCASFLLQRA